MWPPCDRHPEVAAHKLPGHPVPFPCTGKLCSLKGMYFTFKVELADAIASAKDKGIYTSILISTYF